jgi:hypothetical protein
LHGNHPLNFFRSQIRFPLPRRARSAQIERANGTKLRAVVWP